MKITISNIDLVYKAKQASIETMELKGYKLIENIMVDNSGFGRDEELAYTRGQFESHLINLLNEHGSLTAKITEVGQFQVYIGLFKKVGKAKAKKIANNTLRIDDGNGNYRIRLHDTDIITYKDGVYTLNNGGYATKTTKSRMNQYLPPKFFVQQIDYQWYLGQLVNDKPVLKPYTNGMTIKENK